MWQAWQWHYGWTQWLWWKWNSTYTGYYDDCHCDQHSLFLTSIYWYHRLTWKVKGFVSTWRRPGFCSLVVTRITPEIWQVPCVVCCSGVRINSILCSQCMLCVHKTCSGIFKWLVEEPNYICPKCRGEFRPIDGRTVTEVDVDVTMLDVDATFCFLGDMLRTGGGCDSAIAARYCLAWGKFRKLLPVLTTWHISPRIRGKVYEACVRSTMLHGSENWGPKECKNSAAPPQ